MRLKAGLCKQTRKKTKVFFFFLIVSFVLWSRKGNDRAKLQKIETNLLYFMGFYQNKIRIYLAFFSFPFLLLLPLLSPCILSEDKYFGGLRRREQGKFFHVLTFSYRIWLCEERRSDSANLPQVFFPKFYAWETDAQKDVHWLFPDPESEVCFIYLSHVTSTKIFHWV